MKFRLILICISTFLLFIPKSTSQEKIDPTTYPYNYVVKLLMYKNGSTFHGTGVLIDKNHVITNAHNVIDKDSVSIHTGYSKNNKGPFGIITVKCILNQTMFYPEEYTDPQISSLFDFAVLKFDNSEVFQKILTTSNKRSFHLEFVDNIDSETLNISGYPFYRFFELWKPKKAKVQIFNSTNHFNIQQNVILNYKLGTRKGSSGSPLWIEKDDKLILIGIHKSGSGSRNQGILYDKKRFEYLKNWINK